MSEFFNFFPVKQNKDYYVFDMDSEKSYAKSQYRKLNKGMLSASGLV